MQLEIQIEHLLKQLTLDEKIILCSGQTGAATAPVERLGIRQVELADGPQGVRVETSTTALPAGIALAAAFDEKLAVEYGALIARECRAKGFSVSLGPGFNLMRTPMNGRNFEYYGEDPVLAGRIAAGYINGCQENGVGAVPKHLALNNQEICRIHGSSNCDERTLRELYLRAFEYVTLNAHPWMMMSSYNKINGVYASECGFIQQGIAKDEWGFDGVMVSDWGAVHNAEAAANNGLDLEMCTSLLRDELPALIKEGRVKESELDDKVRRILRLCARTGNLGDMNWKGEAECNTQRHQRFAEKTAVAGSVLLKNRNSLLPLDKTKIKKLLITGPNADQLHTMLGGYWNGGGSGGVLPEYEITPIAGLREYLGTAVKLIYQPDLGFPKAFAPFPAEVLPDGVTATVYDLETGRELESFQLTETLKEWKPASSRCKVHLKARLHSDKIRRGVIYLESVGGTLRIRLDGREILRNECFGECMALQAPYPLELRPDEEHCLEADFELLSPENAKAAIYWEEEIVPVDQKILHEIAEEVDAVIYFGGRNHRYDSERPGRDAGSMDVMTWQLPLGQNDSLIQLCQANDNVIGVFFSGSSFAAPWFDEIGAMLEVFYPGQESGRAIAKMLFGDAEPGGRLPFTWGKRYLDYSCHANGCYPGERGINAYTDYKEGLYIGYRHFDRAGIEPLFPFGFGLNYGGAPEMGIKNVRLGNVSLALQQLELEITVSLRNSNQQSAIAVPQLYLADHACSLDRPDKELVHFAKMVLLPGESRDVTWRLSFRDLAFYDPRLKRFSVEAGEFEMLLGYNAGEICDCVAIKIPEQNINIGNNTMGI